MQLTTQTSAKTDGGFCLLICAADGEVTATVTLTNMGNVKLTDIALSSTQWHTITCTTTNNATVAELLVGLSKICTAKYTLTQMQYEQAALANPANTGSFATNIMATSKAANKTLIYNVAEVTKAVAIPTVYSAGATISVVNCDAPDARKYIRVMICNATCRPARTQTKRLAASWRDCNQQIGHSMRVYGF